MAVFNRRKHGKKLIDMMENIEVPCAKHRVSGNRAPKAGIAHHSFHFALERVDVTQRNQNTVRSRNDDLPEAADVSGNNRNSRSHCFDCCDPKPLPAGRKKNAISTRKELWNVAPFAEKPHPLAKPIFLRKRFKPRPLLPVSRNKKKHAWDVPQGSKKNIKAFLTRQAAYKEKEERALRHTEFLPFHTAFSFADARKINAVQKNNNFPAVDTVAHKRFTDAPRNRNDTVRKPLKHPINEKLPRRLHGVIHVMLERHNRWHAAYRARNTPNRIRKPQMGDKNARTPFADRQDESEPRRKVQHAAENYIPPITLGNPAFCKKRRPCFFRPERYEPHRNPTTDAFVYFVDHKPFRATTWERVDDKCYGRGPRQ